MALKCSHCDKLFSTQFNLNKHLRSVHRSEPKITKYPYETKYYCIDCASYFKFNNELRKHLEIKHDFNNVIEELKFESFNDFNQWLSEEENTNNLQYVRHAGKKSSAFGFVKIYYECRRSYRCKRNIINRIRRERLQGSCKMDKSCTSQIIIDRNVNTDECFVTYYKSHYLHNNDEIEHLQISKKDKESIVSKLVIGMSPKDILYSTRNSIGSDLKRIDLLVMKDIHNIKASYKIDNKIVSQLEIINDDNNHHQIKETIKMNFAKILNNIDHLNKDQLTTILQYSNLCVLLPDENELDLTVDKNKKRFDIISNVVKQIKQESIFSNKKNRVEPKILNKFVDNKNTVVISDTVKNDHHYIKYSD